MWFENGCFLKNSVPEEEKVLLNYTICAFQSLHVLFSVFIILFEYSTMLLVDLSFSCKCKWPVTPVTTSKAGRLHSQVEKQCRSETWLFYFRQTWLIYPALAFKMINVLQWSLLVTVKGLSSYCGFFCSGLIIIHEVFLSVTTEGRKKCNSSGFGIHRFVCL